MIIQKKTVQDYENSWHTDYIATAEFWFERDIIERYLSQAQEECKATLRRLTKGDNNG